MENVGEEDSCFILPHFLAQEMTKSQKSVSVDSIQFKSMLGTQAKQKKQLWLLCDHGCREEMNSLIQPDQQSLFDRGLAHLGDGLRGFLPGVGGQEMLKTTSGKLLGVSST